MQSSENASHRLPLGETLKGLLKAYDEHGLSIREITRAVGEKGFGLPVSYTHLTLPTKA